MPAYTYESGEQIKMKKLPTPTYLGGGKLTLNAPTLNQQQEKNPIVLIKPIQENTASPSVKIEDNEVLTTQNAIPTPVVDKKTQTNISKNLDQDVVNLAKAIRQMESGNRAVLPGEGAAVGGASRYQYTHGTWKAVAGKYLGDPNAPLNLENENKATYLRIKDWKDQGYNPAQIASMWNAGEGRPNAYKENWRGINKYGVKYDTPAYVNKVYSEYQRLKALTPKQEQQKVNIPQIEQKEKTGIIKGISDYIKSDFAGEAMEPSGSIAKDMVKEMYRNTLGSGGVSGFVSRAATGLLKMGEKAIGKDTEKEYMDLMESTNGLVNSNIDIIKKSRTETDPKKLQKLQQMYETNLETIEDSQKVAKMLENKNPTYRNTISSAINTFLTLASLAEGLGIGGVGLTGSMIGGLGKGGTTIGLAAKYLPESQRLSKVLTAGKGVVPRAIESGFMGTGYQAAYNIEQGKPLTENLAFSTAFGAALPLAGTALGKGKQVVAQKTKIGLENYSARIINSYIKPQLKFFEYGKNAGRGVAREGIVANSIDDLTNKVSAKVDELGSLINTETQKVQGSTQIDDLFKNIDNTITNLKKAPNTNAHLITKLNGIKADVINYLETELSGWKEAYNIADANQLLELKRFIGGLARFTGNESDDKIVNMPLKMTYGSLKSKLNTLAKKSGIDLSNLNERFADLITAKVALENRAKLAQKQNLVTIIDKNILGVGAIGAIFNPAYLAGAVATWGINRLLSSAAFKTRFAAYLLKATPKERVSLYMRIPILKNYLDILFGRGKKPTMKEVIKTLDTIKEEVPFTPAGLIEAPKQINLPQTAASTRAEQVAAAGIVPQPEIPKALTQAEISAAKKAAGIYKGPEAYFLPKGAKKSDLSRIPPNSNKNVYSGQFLPNKGDGKNIGKTTKLKSAIQGLKNQRGSIQAFGGDDLLQEAKKYKTAEEFVKAQGSPVYHGTNAEFDVFEGGHRGVKVDTNGGFYFSPYKKTAENFGKNVKEVFLDIKNPKIAKTYREIGTLKKADIEQAIKEGYDGYYFKPSAEDLKSGYMQPYNEEWVAFKPEQIKTKSQLTDIWNKANKKNIGKTLQSPLMIGAAAGTAAVSAPAIYGAVKRNKNNK